MDLFDHLSSNPSYKPIRCIDMHTSGELTRIIVSGYPQLNPGTLLAQRAQARSQHDHIRQRLLHEPRGHTDAYGAILRPETELTSTGAAHIGVLFLTNDEYSLMCGHATIALGRLLIDTHDTTLFPRRKEVPIDTSTSTARINLHAPCGLIQVTVPVDPSTQKSDPLRPVSFVNVPAYATGVSVPITIPPALRWPQLPDPTLSVDFSYGGAFFAFVPTTSLGFPGLHSPDTGALNHALSQLRETITTDSSLRHLYTHPTQPDLSGIYCYIATDPNLGEPEAGAAGAETGYCFFGHGQVDRSPTGSGATARVALACAPGDRNQEAWTYHSLVSNRYGGGFTARVVEVCETNETNGKFPVVRVEVAGRAFYTGAENFVVEAEDCLGDGGFLIGRLGSGRD